tara:strand:- start:144 stop:398 length:255 start_codon:yes stop_codon:yes gene_type:complete
MSGQIESQLWRTNIRFVEVVNDMTEEIIKLKRDKMVLKNKNARLSKELEGLKQKYYKNLADENQRKNSLSSKRSFSKWFLDKLN